MTDPDNPFRPWKKGEPVTMVVVLEAMTDLHLAAVDLGVALDNFIAMNTGGPIDVMERVRTTVKIVELEMKLRLDKVREGEV